ncbi:GNAT family N-acetyltransferase [Halovivax limisalsi]|uniref:GNAT family N-acetyltransferase n=1 Tax=Halovivax limisalsi TaxID=1453760 RepID=UPI001FFC50DF|nr:GNAT family N-acetyltransferase [Halovivax limisalsi]
MQLTRRYPDEPADPFPAPPATFVDDEGRRMQVEALDSDAAVTDALTAMYDRFHPADRAQGIPPTGEDRIREWLAPLVDDGVNVGVRPVSSDDAPPYVGHAVLVPDTDDPEGTDPGDHEWELAIFVLRAYQGAGVGTELLAHLLGEAETRGIEHVWLTVERWNSAAITLYERTGFETVGRESFDLEMAIRLDGER